MTWRARSGALVAVGLGMVGLAAGLVACAIRPVASGAPDEVVLPAVLSLPGYPLRLKDRPTTDAGVYMGNLRARLDALTARGDAGSASVLAQRASSHFALYRIEGRPEDLAAAEALAARAVVADPDVGAAWLTQAAILAYLHRFDPALAALEQAERTRVAPDQIAQIRRSIQVARGVPAPAKALAPAEIVQASDAVERAHECVELGDLKCASENFHMAQFLDNDSAPLPLAWLHTQQGIALLRFGHPAAAIPFFQAALERLPGYYVALEHLAECQGLVGNFAESRQLYAQVIAQTRHPEYMGGFAGMLRAAGDAEGAAHWQERALTGYHQLLDKDPAAYAGHAIGFFLEHDQARLALDLARKNLAIRQDAGSWLLLAEAAAAAGQCAESQQALAQSLATGWRPPELAATSDAVRTCQAGR